MKFKEIKPGMVIHCPKEEDARVLLEHLESLGYKWFPSGKLTEDMRYERYGSDSLYCIDLNGKTMTICNLNNRLSGAMPPTEFSDLIEPDDSPINSPMSAVEMLDWFRNASAALIMHLFNGWDDINFILGQYSSEEIVQKISAYEATKKSPVPAKEPIKPSDTILPGKYAALKRVGELTHELYKYASTPAILRMDEDAVRKMNSWAEEITMQLDIIDWSIDFWQQGGRNE